MFLKRKRRVKLKAKKYAEGCHHHMFNNVSEPSSKLLQSNTHKGCCVLNDTGYNDKIRSVIGWENDSKVMKWTWLNKQVRDTFLCSWMISRELNDHNNLGRAIGRILGNTICVNEGQHWICNLIFPYINGITPWIEWSFRYT